MKRTITIKNRTVFYRNVDLGQLVFGLEDQFGLRFDGKYSITVKENIDGVFSFETDEDSYYELHHNGKYIGIVCMEHFDKLFFTPDERRNYYITVKKVK